MSVTSSLIIFKALYWARFFTIFIDPVIKIIKKRVLAYADDIKLVTQSNRAAIQNAVSLIEMWLKDNVMPLAVEKFSDLHCDVTTLSILIHYMVN